ncbi:MAG: F0F1 ATP synthase subunit B [Desulfobacteraceae bacterium]
MLRRQESQGKRSVFIIFPVIAFFLLCGASFAAGGHEGADRSGDLVDLLYRAINFALLAIILFWALKKVGIKDFFSARSEEIRQRLDDLKKGKEEAENRYQEMEKKLREFGDEKEEIIEQFKREGLAEKEKIIAEAKERVQQIIEQAELTIQQEMGAARDRLKEEVVGLATEKAQEIISKEITDKDQEQLVDEFIERVGKTH